MKYQDVVFAPAPFDTIRRVLKKDSAISDQLKQEPLLQPQDHKVIADAASLIAIAVVAARQGLYRRSLWKLILLSAV